MEDLAEFSKARAALGGDEDAEKHKLHAANMVPRFGSDLGLTSRGIQARPAHHLAQPRADHCFAGIATSRNMLHRLQSTMLAAACAAMQSSVLQ